MKIKYLLWILGLGLLGIHCSSAPKTPPRPIPHAEMIVRYVYFDTDTALISLNAEAALEEIALRLGAHPKNYAIIIGHTDIKGKTEHNAALSEARARSVAAYLSQRFEDSRITILSKGESAPLSEEDSETAHEHNRRVEIQLVLFQTT